MDKTEVMLFLTPKDFEDVIASPGRTTFHIVDAVKEFTTSSPTSETWHVLLHQLSKRYRRLDAWRATIPRCIQVFFLEDNGIGKTETTTCKREIEEFNKL